MSLKVLIGKSKWNFWRCLKWNFDLLGIQLQQWDGLFYFIYLTVCTPFRKAFFSHRKIKNSHFQFSWSFPPQKFFSFFPQHDVIGLVIWEHLDLQHLEEPCSFSTLGRDRSQILNTKVSQASYSKLSYTM